MSNSENLVVIDLEEKIKHKQNRRGGFAGRSFHDRRPVRRGGFRDRERDRGDERDHDRFYQQRRGNR